MARHQPHLSGRHFPGAPRGHAGDGHGCAGLAAADAIDRPGRVASLCKHHLERLDAIAARHLDVRSIPEGAPHRAGLEALLLSQLAHRHIPPTQAATLEQLELHAIPLGWPSLIEDRTLVVAARIHPHIGRQGWPVVVQGHAPHAVQLGAASLVSCALLVGCSVRPDETHTRVRVRLSVRVGQALDCGGEDRVQVCE